MEDKEERKKHLHKVGDLSVARTSSLIQHDHHMSSSFSKFKKYSSMHFLNYDSLKIGGRGDRRPDLEGVRLFNLLSGGHSADRTAAGAY